MGNEELLIMLCKVLKPHQETLTNCDFDELQQMVVGMNGVILENGRYRFDFIEDDMLFPSAFAEVLIRLDVHEGREWLDIDFHDLASCVGGGIDSALKGLFSAEGYNTIESNGENAQTWDSFILTA